MRYLLFLFVVLQLFAQNRETLDRFDSIRNQINTLSVFDLSAQMSNSSIESNSRAISIGNSHSHIFDIIEKTNAMNEEVILSSLTVEDIVIGFEDPDEIVVIDSDTMITGNFVLVNNAQLIIRDCTYYHRGNIIAMHNTRVFIEDVDFRLLQDFIYQYMFIVLDSAGVEIGNSRFNSASLPSSVGITSRGIFTMDSVNMDGGFITFGIMESADVNIRYTEHSA